MRRSNLMAGLGLATLTATTVMFNALPALAEERPAAKPDGNPTALAQTAADRFVARSGDAAVLFKGPGDRLVQRSTITGGNGLRYVTYDRTYHGLPVAGGDAVVLTDASGTVKAATTGQKTTVNVPTAARFSSGKAAAVAKKQLKRVDDSAAPKLVVDAYHKTPRLAWEVKVAGLNKQDGPSRLHVFVDALTGKVLDTTDDVKDGAGTGRYSGKVTLQTTNSAGTYLMKGITYTGLQCGDGDGSVPYSSSTDVWGNGSGTDLVTACVDGMYAAQKQMDMLKDWMGRDGIDGRGHTFPIGVGLNDANAYWFGDHAKFGHNSAGTQQATSLDVVGHEFGHGIFRLTPGGVGSGGENAGLDEGSGDIWGTLTEAYANNPNDKPDYEIAEKVNFGGTGAIRYMYDASKAGAPNCYSGAISGTQRHAAAGPLDHWFYLVAEGNNPSNGNPVSPTCDGFSVGGIGLQTAGKIFYNAELMKTSTWDYPQVRVASLTAAKNLYPTSCVEFNAVKSAWDAVSVPAQAGEPNCAPASEDFGIYVDPSSARVGAGSSVAAQVHVSHVAGSIDQTVALTVSGLPAGATASFSKPQVGVGGQATMTVATSASTPPGTYTIAVTGTGVGATHSQAYTLAVADSSCSGTNGTDLAIPDTETGVVTSPITITGCGVTPSPSSNIEVHIVHGYRGDVVIDLVAPDGTSYPLKPAVVWDRVNDVNETYTADVSSETANGTWQLRVKDVSFPNAGHIDSWTLTL